MACRGLANLILEFRCFSAEAGTPQKVNAAARNLHIRGASVLKLGLSQPLDLSSRERRSCRLSEIEV